MSEEIATGSAVVIRGGCRAEGATGVVVGHRGLDRAIVSLDRGPVVEVDAAHIRKIKSRRQR